MANPVEKAAFERRDERGTLMEVRNRGPWEAVLTGVMKAGAVMGNHYHRRTRVYFFLIAGRALVDVVRVPDGKVESLALPAGHGVLLDPFESHAIRFQEESRYILLKDTPYDPKDPDTFSHPIA
jgi:mannose-6-phosphate isomerase-like protein (cupin superfamily)